MTQSLQTLLQHAERERDAALADLLQAEDHAQRVRQQWEQLRAYHAEYAARAPGHGGRSAGIAQLQAHHAFMQRLDQALAHQQRLLDAAEQQVPARRQMLLQRETRVASVRKLAERRHQEQQRAATRREQQRSDEAATQRLWRNSAHLRNPVSP